jgi:hypothetical protein
MLTVKPGMSMLIVEATFSFLEFCTTNLFETVVAASVELYNAPPSVLWTDPPFDVTFSFTLTLSDAPSAVALIVPV